MPEWQIDLGASATTPHLDYDSGSANPAARRESRTEALGRGHGSDRRSDWDGAHTAADTNFKG